MINQVQEVEIDSLKSHPNNYRTHGEDQLVHIMESIEKNGFYKNIVVANDGTILAGHGAVAAARKLGYKTIPVVKLDLDPMDKRALKILVGDNEIANLGMVDDRKLSEILKDISVSMELIGTGFDSKQLMNLVFVTRDSSEIKDHSAAAEWLGMPSYQVEDNSKAEAPTLVVSFVNVEDRQKFVDEFKLRISGTRGDVKWTTTWPYIERNDTKSVKFEGQEP